MKCAHTVSPLCFQSAHEPPPPPFPTNIKQIHNVGPIMASCWKTACDSDPILKAILD